MIDNCIEDIFTSINNSDEYKEYMNISNILKNNKEVSDLIEEIKTLQKKATKMEYNGDLEYKEIDKIIKEKTDILNSNKDYIEYLNKLNNFNKTLLASSSLIEEYVSDKVSI